MDPVMNENASHPTPPPFSVAAFFVSQPPRATRGGPVEKAGIRWSDLRLSQAPGIL